MEHLPVDSRGGSRGAHPGRRRHQNIMLPNFPKNCMKLRTFWDVGGIPGLCPRLASGFHYLVVPARWVCLSVCLSKTCDAYKLNLSVCLTEISLTLKMWPFHRRMSGDVGNACPPSPRHSNFFPCSFQEKTTNNTSIASPSGKSWIPYCFYTLKYIQHKKIFCRFNHFFIGRI